MCERIIALIDMDCFFCQVEERLDPSLKGKPMAVVQYNKWMGGGINFHKGGRIIAVNYEARAFGVSRHHRGDVAKQKCKDIILVSVPSDRGKADGSKLRQYDDKFLKYFRMSVATFAELLHCLSPSLLKSDTNVRNAISPSEKVAFTLRVQVGPAVVDIGLKAVFVGDVFDGAYVTTRFLHRVFAHHAVTVVRLLVGLGVPVFKIDGEVVIFVPSFVPKQVSLTDMAVMKHHLLGGSLHRAFEVSWSEFLATDSDVPRSIPGTPGWDSNSDLPVNDKQDKANLMPWYTCSVVLMSSIKSGSYRSHDLT
ncbi:unnamed protein product [Timema podura]|uniref:UmuC domain-containing protein n=1 Tax=Timema podura TaxID=61482 RepID=A0ABN7NSJ3_TIMPD|nr:unnamed protein product [Timema podura]